MNIAVFLILFASIVLLSLIVYWIVILCLHIKNKKEGVKPEKNASYWWLKVLGGGIGMVGSIVIAFVLLTPMFGVMNVCNKFVSRDSNSAVAASPNTYLCGELYYTEDKNIGQVEGYIEKYAEIKKTYDKSFIGGVFNFTGISKLGTSTFNYLTNVNPNGLKVNVTDELVALIDTYNVYKESFIENEFDIADNASLDRVMKIYDIANNSEIVKSYIEEFIPKFCSRWLAGEKFLGIEMPIKGEFKPIAEEVLQVFNTANSTRIKANVKAVVGAIKVANNNKIIEDVRKDKDLIDILSSNETFVKEEIVQLSSTNELKYALPQIMNEFIQVAYKEVVGSAGSFEDTILTNQQIDSINWNNEAGNLQYMSNKVLDVYNATQKDTSENTMLDQLTNVGIAIDSARDSVIVSAPFKVFIVGFINSNNVNLDADVKTTINDTISDKWDDADFSFATTFTAIQETAKIANSILGGSGSVDLESLSGVLSEIITNPSAQTTINNILGSDIVKDMVGSDAVVDAMTDMLDTLVNDTNTQEELEKAISSGQEIVNLVNNSKNNDSGLVLDGETDAEKTANAETIIENIANSNVVMGLLQESASTEGSAISEVMNGLGGDTEILNNLFA